jgi:hypothetical protein
MGQQDLDIGYVLTFKSAIVHSSHQLPFNSCCDVQVLHNLPPNANHITCHNLKLAYQFILYSRHSPGIFSFPSIPSFFLFLPWWLLLETVMWHQLYSVSHTFVLF